MYTRVQFIPLPLPRQLTELFIDTIFKTVGCENLLLKNGLRNLGPAHDRVELRLLRVLDGSVQRYSHHPRLPLPRSAQHNSCKNSLASFVREHASEKVDVQYICSSNFA